MRTNELHAHAKQVKRSSGRSSVAAAAYRSASRFEDERTGEIHDYTNKMGVEHTQIFTPDNAPAWASDRAQLWNACERKENRANSCTAHELELSFPHEFNPMQRREAGSAIALELVRRYGVAVDIAYHRPSGEADERNFHAHLLFTTRGFDRETKDGWEKSKFRDLSQDKVTDREGNATTRGKVEIAELREFTAQQLNRIAERDRLDVRTEHLSFEARGIDREPTQHLGPVANDMENKGKRSRIGDDNRATDQRNSERATYHLEAVAVQNAIAREKGGYRDWLARKSFEMEAAQEHTRLDLDRRQHQQKQRLEADLKDQYGTAKATITAELATVNRKLEAKGVRKVLRNVFGKTKADTATREQLQDGLRDIRQRETEQRDALKVWQQRQNEQLKKKQQQRKDRLADDLRTAAAAKEAEWKRRTATGTWKDKVRKVDMQPTQGQENVLKKRDLDPAQFNRVTAAQEIQKIAERENWPKKPLVTPSAKKSPIEARTEAKATPAPSKTTPTAQAHERATQPNAEPLDKLSIDDKKRVSDTHLTDKGALGGNWKDNASSWKDRANSWEGKKSEHWSKGKTRSKSDSKPSGGGKSKP